MLIYNYNPITREYTTSNEAEINPFDSNDYFIPANATDIKPLKNKKGYAILWAGNKWEYKEDHRGEVLYNANIESEETISFIGELPDYYYQLNSVRANKPAGNYWVYDNKTDTWIGNPVDYKLYVFNNASSYWNTKLNQPFEFKGFKYLPVWRELYTSIWTALRDGIKDKYRLQDANGKINTVDINSMKEIMGKMSDIVDEMYNDKHILEAFFKSNNNFDDLQQAFDKWLKKEYS